MDIPQDLAGYQLVCNGTVIEGDLIVDAWGEKDFAVETGFAGHEIDPVKERLLFCGEAFRVYRASPVAREIFCTSRPGDRPTEPTPTMQASNCGHGQPARD